MSSFVKKLLKFPWTTKRELRDQIAELRQDLDEFSHIFWLRGKADQRARKIWQEAHPDKENIWPDHCDLVMWLMDWHEARLNQIKELQGRVQELLEANNVHLEKRRHLEAALAPQRFWTNKPWSKGD